jgi:hypothetical protein
VTQAQRIATAVLAGLVCGFVILGVGGRVAMRVVGLTTPEPARFSLVGTLQVVGLGTVWGGVTAPLFLFLESSRRLRGYGVSLVFGGMVLGLAVLTLFAVLGPGGSVKAPPAFIILSALLFPILFLVHGVGVAWLVQRGRRSGTARKDDGHGRTSKDDVA